MRDLQDYLKDQALIPLPSLVDKVSLSTLLVFIPKPFHVA